MQMFRAGEEKKGQGDSNPQNGGANRVIGQACVLPSHANTPASAASLPDMLLGQISSPFARYATRTPRDYLCSSGGAPPTSAKVFAHLGGAGTAGTAQPRQVPGILNRPQQAVVSLRHTGLKSRPSEWRNNEGG